MSGFITTMVTNTLQNAASGFVTSGVSTVGSYAGDGISGVGNMIDRAGEGLGNGISGKIDGWGSYIRSYGDSVQRATAPNSAAGNYSRDGAKSKKPTEQKKAAPKVAGSKPAGTFYTPYSPNVNSKKPEQKKALPAPSSVGQKKPLTASNLKALNSTANGAKKPGAPSVAGTVASKAPTAKTGRPTGLSYQTPAKTPDGKVRVSNQSKPGYKPPPSQAPGQNNSSGYKPPGQGNNSNNNNNKGAGGSAPRYTPAQKNANGKVIASKEANPYAVKPSYKPPASVAGGGQKYQGPLNLGGIASSKAGSVAGGNNNKKPEAKKTAQKSDGPQQKSGGYEFF